MRAHWILFLSTIITLSATVAGVCYAAQGAQSTTPAPTPQALEKAVRQGDLGAVERLLDAGVDANAELRNGYTAIFHAVDRNRIDIVEELLDHGARVDFAEGFFHTTPLERALGDGSKELALLLLKHGPGRLDRALQHADIDIVRAALAVASPLYEYQRASALRAAEAEDRGQIVALLKSAEVDAGWPDIVIPKTQLEAMAGTYAGGNEAESTEWLLRVGRDSDVGHPPVVLEGESSSITDLVAVGAREFRSRSQPTHTVALWGRGPSIERMAVIGPDGPIFLRRQAPSTTDLPIADSPTEPSRPSRAEQAVSTEPSPSAPWSSFRGPGGSGVADGLGLPTTWDLPSGKNVLWRVAVPGLGLGSPVTDGERIYLTTAVSGAGNTSMELGHYGNPASVDDDSVHTWQMLAYDADSGELVWQRNIAEAHPGSKRHLKSSQANSTAVTDGQRVVAVLPTAGLVCYRASDGELLWRRPLGALPSGPYGGVVEWGFAASPILWQGKLILQVDIHGGAYIAAWDVENGEPLWRTERQEIPTWSTPILFEGASCPELIANGTTIRGYDPRNGRELWQLGPNSEVIVSSPVAGDGLIYITGGYPPARPVYAVRPGSRGDLSSSMDGEANPAVAWSKSRGGVYIPTPLVYRGILYLIHGQGRIEALDATDGRRLYRARLSRGGTVSGSAIASDGRIYIPTEEGSVYVVDAGPTYSEPAINAMGEAVMTVPAAAENTLFIRGLEHLIAIRDQPRQDQTAAPADGSQDDVP